MKTIAIGLTQGSRYARFSQWARLVTITGSAQLVLQAVNLVSGILIVRCLPVKEYAFYTLANTMLGTMTVFADSGISVGVMTNGGKVWQKPQQLGAVLSTGLHLRRKFAVFSLLVTQPFLLYLLLHHGASLPVSVLIMLALIPAFYAALSDTLLEVVPKLHQDILPLQKNQVAAALSRFALTLAGILVLPFAFIPIAASGISRMWANMRLRRISVKYADLAQAPDPGVRKSILVLVRRMLPGAVYYCLSGQITIWLISVFGSTSSVAQLGALGRIAAVFTIVPTMFSTLVVPRFARLPFEKKLVLARFFQILGLLLLITAASVVAVMLFPSQVLWVLGKEYAGLTTELMLMTVSCCAGLIAGVVHDTMTARGIVLPPLLNIGSTLAVQILLLLVFDLSSVVNVLLFSIANFVFLALLMAGYFLFRIFFPIADTL